LPVRADAHRPALRGPVQDERLIADPFDIAARRAVEGEDIA
jgi:hypothetical protein